VVLDSNRGGPAVENIIRSEVVVAGIITQTAAEVVVVAGDGRVPCSGNPDEGRCGKPGRGPRGVLAQGRVREGRASPPSPSTLPFSSSSVPESKEGDRGMM